MPDIRALIVDDEPLARRGIRQLLAPFRDIVVVGECRDGREALRALEAQRPDLVFLDVEMPGLDGLGVIRAHGATRMPLTIFVTAHEEFAVSAFDTAAVDYLVKPLSERRFRAAIARVRERLGAGRGTAAAATPGPLVVPTPAGEVLIEPAEITWIEAQDDHVVVHAGGRAHRLRASLAALEPRLRRARFARVHRQALVRLDEVRELRANGDQATLLLKDGTTVPVSRRQLGTVRALLKDSGRRSPR
jgi:two-component system LytT family response regulator